MPHSRSAKKRMRQSQRQREQNRIQRSALRTLIKKVRSAGGGEEAQNAYRKAERLLDRASRKRLIHPNKAARTKSRLAKLMASQS